jgi:hypothetical protein
MRAPLILLLSLAVAALPRSIGPQTAGDEGFHSLFDGVTLAGWHQISLGETPGTWRAQDGILTYDSGDSWLASDLTYADFTLRLEYRAGVNSDSGIFLRSTPTGYPSFTGMELEIKDDPGAAPNPRTTGALYGAAAPLKSANRPAGEWNQVEVTVAGRHVTTIWNGERIHDVNLDDPAYANAQRGPLAGRARTGHIGFQAHLTGAPVEFRRIRIKVIAASDATPRF